MSEIKLKLNIDTTEAEQKIKKVDLDVKETSLNSDAALKQIEIKRQISLSGIKQFAFSAFNILDSTLAMFGVTMSQGLKLISRGIFAAIPPLFAIFTAQEVSGVMALQAAMGFIQLGFAFAGAMQIESLSNQQEQQFKYFESLSRSIINIAGRW